MKPLDQCVLGNIDDIVVIFLVEKLIHLRLGGVSSLFFFCCMSGNEPRVNCIILGL